MEDKSEVEQIYSINKKLLKIIDNNLNEKEVPSKELLDTITTSLTITAALPWSKYDIKEWV